LPDLGEGTYTIEARAFDNLDNKKQARFEVTNDNTGPTVSLDSPFEGSAVQDLVTLTFSASDVSGVQEVKASIRRETTATAYKLVLRRCKQPTMRI